MRLLKISIKYVLPNLITIFLFSSYLTATEKYSCTGNWLVTGYFTPYEIDYPRYRTNKVRVQKLGHRRFSTGFLKAVKMEGRGRTNEGWYLGYWGRRWHRSDKPLNANGYALEIGSMATDRRVISNGKRVVIPTLPYNMKNTVFSADDVGSAIKGKHIDIYTGEGKEAEQLTYKITGKQHLVCKIVKITYN